MHQVIASIAIVALLITVVVIGTNVHKNERFQTQQRLQRVPRIVVSMTTSPRRLNQISDTIRSLYHNQTVKPNTIELNLPHVFKRDGSTFDRAQLKPFEAMHFVQINRCDDIGPITKFVPTVVKYTKEPDTMIIVVDDDTLYPPKMIETFIEASARAPNAIITSHCTNWYTKNDTECDLLEGFKSYLLKPRHFDKDFWEYLRVALESPACYVSDDYVLSNYVHTMNIPIVLLDPLDVGETPQLDYGFEDDALHKQDSDAHTQVRYCGCYKHLEAKVPKITTLRARCAF